MTLEDKCIFVCDSHLFLGEVCLASIVPKLADGDKIVVSKFVKEVYLSCFGRGHGMEWDVSFFD